MLERITKGLVYGVLKFPLPLHAPIEARTLVGDEAFEKTHSLFVGQGFKHRKVGRDFEFWYGLHIEDFTSWWLMRFFGQVNALAVTGGAAKKARAAPSGPGGGVFSANGRLWPMGKVRSRPP